MHLSLDNACQILYDLKQFLLCICNTSTIALSKNTDASGKKGLFSPVAFYILVVEKGNDGLGHRHTFCCLLVHIRSPIIKKPTRVNPSAFALGLFGFSVCTWHLGAAGSGDFHDPLGGPETKIQRG